MASEKTTAIVLRLVEFSETSLIVTMMTRDFGKLGVLAKGARRPKSSSEGALDLLALCRVVIIRKSSDALALLTEAKLERVFRAGRRDLKRLYAAYYVAELLREFTDENDPAPELFDLADLTLQQLDADTEVDACLLRFEIQLLRLIGHLPMLDACAVCGKPAPASVRGGRVHFGWQAGGLLCSNCRSVARGVSLIRTETVDWMRLASQTPGGSPPTLHPSIGGELRGLLNQYLTHLAGGPLRLRGLISGSAAKS